MHYFEVKDDCPTPLHDLETGLVQPDYLAFLCSQVLDDNSPMLGPKFNLELTHLALVLYIYGQYCVSLHSSHIGLFRGDVYTARAIMANTADIASAPPKNLADVEEPDITEKFEELKAAKRMIKTSYNPYTTNARVVPKSRGPARTLEFSKDSVILKYLLSLSHKQLDELQQASDKIGEAKKTLEKVLVSKEEEEMYEKMMKETMDQVEKEEAKTKIMNEEKITEEKVNRIRQRDQSMKILMGKPARQDNDTVSWNYNNGEEATPTTKISITTNIQDPELNICKSL